MIPVYNNRQYIRQTLESVLSQSWLPSETQITVVDNCSTPEQDPAAVIAEINSPHIEFIRNYSNLGISGNFNRCIELARGDWVHLLHSDDFVHPHFYQEWKSIIDSHSVDAVVFRCNFVDDQNRPCEASLRVAEPDSQLSASIQFGDIDPLKLLRNEILQLRPLPCAGLIVRRSVFEELGGYCEEFGYSLDVEMMSRIFFNRPTHFSDQRLASFRIHGQSAGARLRNELVNAEYYALTPRLAENMNLSRDEIKRYRLFCHKAARDRCKELADAGAVSLWLRCQKLYFNHLESPREYLDYFLRLNRCLIRFLRARVGFPVS